MLFILLEHEKQHASWHVSCWISLIYICAFWSVVTISLIIDIYSRSTCGWHGTRRKVFAHSKNNQHTNYKFWIVTFVYINYIAFGLCQLFHTNNS